MKNIVVLTFSLLTHTKHKKIHKKHTYLVLEHPLQNCHCHCNYGNQNLEFLIIFYENLKILVIFSENILFDVYFDFNEIMFL